jgi:hypothetical protein
MIMAITPLIQEPAISLISSMSCTTLPKCSAGNLFPVCLPNTLSSHPINLH